MSFQDLEAGRIPAAQMKRGGGAPAGQTASQAVAAGIFQINTSVATFQRLVNSLGTPKDTADLRDRLYVILPHLFQINTSATTLLCIVGNLKFISYCDYFELEKNLELNQSCE